MGKKRRMRAKLNKFGHKFRAHPRVKSLQQEADEKPTIEQAPPAPKTEPKAAPAPKTEPKAAPAPKTEPDAAARPKATPKTKAPKKPSSWKPFSESKKTK